MIKKSHERTLELKDKLRGGDGTITFEHFFKQEDMKANCRLCAKIIIPVGASIGLHQHNKEDELYIILQGKGLVNEGSTQTEVQPGDSVLTGNGQSHSIKNIGNTNLELIAVIMCY